MKFPSKLYRSKKIEELPFDEDEILEKFEECLYFSYSNNEIKELDLRYVSKIEEQPPMGDHLFILGWNDPQREGKYLIKEFKLKEDFNC